jgi:hypothetical protein
MLEEVSKRPGGNPAGRFSISLVRGQHEGWPNLMMDRVPEGADGPDAVLEVAENLYRDAAVELYRTITALRLGEFTEVKAAQTAIRDLRATALHVLDERNKVDKLRKQIAGQVGAGGDLDFDGARLEIGRRLACLRDAGGGG